MSAQPRPPIRRGSDDQRLVCEAYTRRLTRCRRWARHFTHVNPGRMIDVDRPAEADEQQIDLCTQHFEMIERHRALGMTGGSLMQLWREMRGE